jgi:hypothetical protein
MHMHLKGLVEVADDEDDDAEADPALQGPMTMRSRCLAELTQWIERAVTLSRAPGVSRFTFGHGVWGDPAPALLKGRMKHPNVNSSCVSGYCSEAWLHYNFGIKGRRLSDESLL